MTTLQSAAAPPSGTRAWRVQSLCILILFLVLLTPTNSIRHGDFGGRFDASADPVLDIFVSPLGDSSPDSCGSSFSNACNILSASLKLSQHPAPQPAARLILLGGLHSVSEAVIFTYSSKLSLLSLNQSYPAIIEATAAAAQLVFTCPLFYGFNFAIQGFQNGSTVFSDSVDLAVFESVRLSDNHVTARGGAAIAFYGRELHLIDSNIESNVAHAASKEDSIVGGAILVQVNLAHEVSIYNISFHNCNISNNQIESQHTSNYLSGGAIGIQETPHSHRDPHWPPVSLVVSLVGCQVRSNMVSIRISAFGSELDSPFISGGAISINFHTSVVRTTISACILASNSVSSKIKAGRVSGGAIYFASTSRESKLVIERTAIVRNSANAGETLLALARSGLCFGGAIAVRSISSVNIFLSNFTTNECVGGQGGSLGSQSHGGAVSVNLSPSNSVDTTNETLIDVVGCIFTENAVKRGYGGGAKPVATGGAIDVEFQAFYVVSGIKISKSLFVGNMVQSYGSIAGGAISIRAGPGISLLSPLSISDCEFSSNKINSEDRIADESDVALLGGALHVDMEIDHASPVALTNSQFVGNAIPGGYMDRQVSGGAAYFRITHLDAPNKPLRQLLVRDCNFSSNIASGLNVHGGAMSLTGIFFANISRSVWNANRVACVGTTGVQLCMGGALSIDFQKYSSRHDVNQANGRIEDNIFWRNQVNADLAGGQCVTIGGGATSLFSSGSMQPGRHVYGQALCLNCTFEENFVSGGVASGGALLSLNTFTTVANSSFLHNTARGAAAKGGAILANWPISIQDSAFLDHNASATESLDCGKGLGLGGTLYLSSIHPSDRNNPIDFGLRNVSISASQADRGGALLLSTGQKYDQPWRVANVSISDSFARKSGGALFADLSCSTAADISDVCDILQTSALRVSALEYGDLCASTVVSLQNAAPEANHTTFVATGQPLRYSFFLVDMFGNRVYGEQNYIVATLSDHSPSVKLHTNNALDRALMELNREMVFPELSISGWQGSHATIAFEAFVEESKQCSDRKLLTKNAVLEIAACLPTYYAIDNSTCQLCPAQTYSIGDHCEPCDEESKVASADYSCLTAAEDAKFPATSRLPYWEIAESYYPSPAPDQVEELVRCPNHACLPFECSIYIHGHDLRWALNCTGCPYHALHEDAGESNPLDCHCKRGYEGRLCSRCSCDPRGDCFFSSGELEERHCTRCQTQSIAVVISTFFVLQVSLVVFLLFQKSALALLLAEVAIVIALILAGIGESWMFDLVIVMGLLFIITSLSRRAVVATRSTRKHRLFQSESEQEDSHHESDEHGEHGDHEEHQATAHVAAMAKIIIFFLQCASAVIQDAAWPSWIGGLMKYLEAINLRLSGVECFSPALLSSPLGKLLFQLSMPLLLALNMALAALFSAAILKLDPISRIRNVFARFRSAEDSRRRVRPNVGDPDDLDSEPSFIIEEDNAEETSLIADRIEDRNPPRSDSLSVRDLVSRLQFSIFFLLSASYFELSSTVLEILRPCSMQGFMQAFPWVQCSTGNMTYISLLSTSIIFLIIYSIGIPSLFGLILLRNRRRIQAGDPALEAKYGFLYESYKPQFYWFELVWFLRRILLAMAVSLMPARPGYQMTIIIIVLQGSIFLHKFLSPFSSNLANILDQVATSVLVFGVVMGFVLNQYKEATSHTVHVHIFALQNIVWISFAAVTVVTAAALLKPTVKAMLAYCRGKLRKD